MAALLPQSTTKHLHCEPNSRFSIADSPHQRFTSMTWQKNNPVSVHRHSMINLNISSKCKGSFSEAGLSYTEKCSFHFSISLAVQQMDAVRWCYIFHDIHSSVVPCYPLFMWPLAAYLIFD